MLGDGNRQENYKEFDRKIRISGRFQRAHHSARSTNDTGIGEDTMSYRLIPVGDKLVLIIDLDQANGREEYVCVQDTKTTCYDFDVERASGNEGLNENTSWIGGISHE